MAMNSRMSASCAWQKISVPRTDGIDFHPIGVEALRKPLELIIQYSVEQKIIPRAFTVDELFDDVTRTLS